MLPEDLMLFVHNSCSEWQNPHNLEELDDFDLVLSTSDTELSAPCTQGPTLSPRDVDKKILPLEPLPRPKLLSSTHKEHSNRFVNPKTDADVQEAQASAIPINTSKSTSWVSANPGW